MNNLRKERIMRSLAALGCLLSVSAVLTGASLAHGQEAAERFIPIGQSPGVSGKASHVGSVQSVNAQVRSMAVDTGAGMVSMQWNERTRIWIDRSRQQKGAIGGSAADVQVGRRVEVKPDKNDRSLAEWIKVEPDASR
jgi:hypothetical protein